MARVVQRRGGDRGNARKIAGRGTLIDTDITLASPPAPSPLTLALSLVRPKA